MTTEPSGNALAVFLASRNIPLYTEQDMEFHQAATVRDAERHDVAMVAIMSTIGGLGLICTVLTLLTPALREYAWIFVLAFIIGGFWAMSSSFHLRANRAIWSTDYYDRTPASAMPADIVDLVIRIRETFGQRAVLLVSQLRQGKHQLQAYMMVSVGAETYTAKIWDANVYPIQVITPNS